VLSSSTRRIDKTIRSLAYQALPTLQEYVLIEQDKAEIDVFMRSSGWRRWSIIILAIALVLHRLV